MSKYTFKTGIDQKRYDAFVTGSPYCNVLQSYKWADIKKNWDHIYTGVEDENGDLVAAGLVLIKRLPAGFSMLYVPRGPIMDFTNQELVKFYFDNLKKEARKQNGLFIKFDPYIVINEYKSKDKNENYIPELPVIMDNLKKAGAIHQGFTTYIRETIQPRFESVIPYSENALDNFTKNTKRNIRIADRAGVEVIHGHGELVEDFARLMAATEERKNINLRDQEYFQTLMDTYGENAHIFIAQSDLHGLYKSTTVQLEDLQKHLDELEEDARSARKKVEQKMTPLQTQKERLEKLFEKGVPEGQVPMAGTLVIHYGPVCEMPYGGMNGDYMKFMPQYKGYQENIRWAFQQGCRTFSMGGVEGTLTDGLTDFKDHFSPMIHEMIGEFDLPVNGLLYRPAKALYQKRKESMTA